jgi:hypothetical protein
MEQITAIRKRVEETIQGLRKENIPDNERGKDYIRETIEGILDHATLHGPLTEYDLQVIDSNFFKTLQDGGVDVGEVADTVTVEIRGEDQDDFEALNLEL